MACTCHTDGTFDSETTDWGISGLVMMVETDPGTPAPLDNYDITLTTATGVDIMGGNLVDRDTADTERARPAVGGLSYSAPAYGRLTLNISGNDVSGALIDVYIFYIEF